MNYKKINDEDDEYLRLLDCSHCKKVFEVSVDKHNVNDGYKSYVPDCKDLKKKHKFELSGTDDWDYEGKKVKKLVYCCKICDETQYITADSHGKKMNKIKEALYLKSLSKESVQVPKTEKTGYYNIHRSLYFKETSIYVRTEKVEGNNLIAEDFLKTILSLGFKQKKLTVDKDRNWVNTSPSGEYKDYQFDISSFPAGCEIKVRTKDRNKELTFLDNMFFKLIENKIETTLNTQYPLINKKKIAEVCHWGRPDLNSAETFEDQVALLRKYVHAEEKSVYNTQDRNKNILKNGHTKYFYDYQGKLSRGEVHHNINNMWYVISKKEIFNIACADLFDYQPNLSLKKPVDKIKVLEKALSLYITNKNFLRCHEIQKQINSLKPL
jgi:hypothetical protein